MNGKKGYGRNDCSERYEVQHFPFELLPFLLPASPHPPAPSPIFGIAQIFDIAQMPGEGEWRLLTAMDFLFHGFRETIPSCSHDPVAFRQQTPVAGMSGCRFTSHE
ncbi:MAG: hypothetical protein NTU44_11510 [Bacteroidetes bacterium]|nr:hypothetical protein [Bacteroidota bacterium]